MVEEQHSPEQQVNELIAQLGLHGRPMMFLLGAGASKAAGLPGIDKLTELVLGSLTGDHANHFRAVRKASGGGNIEMVLNRLRLMQELLGPRDKLHSMTLKDATELDTAICEGIISEVSPSEAPDSPSHVLFARWIRSTQSPIPIEVFTTNYDLIIELALEKERVPFFDGFVGAVRPFFLASAVDEIAGPMGEAESVPHTWTRLWKIHGSVGWRLVQESGQRVVVRDLSDMSGGDLVIYPSLRKYEEARRLPFLTLLDRLRSALMQPEPLLIVCGYSFADDHITEVLTEGVRVNQRAHIVVLCHGGIPSVVEDAASRLPNLTVLGRRNAIVATRRGAWTEPADPEGLRGLWSTDEPIGLRLGEFGAFASFLETLFQLPEPDPASENGAQDGN